MQMSKGQLIVRVHEILATPGTPHWNRAKEIADKMREDARNEAHNYRRHLLEATTLNSAGAMQNPLTSPAPEEEQLLETVKEWMMRTGKKPSRWPEGITGRPKLKHSNKL